jgi:hypothetical protein
MRLLGQANASLAKTVARPPGQKQMRQDDPPPVTIGMLLPLLWSGHAARCGDRLRRLRGIERPSTG